MEMEHDITVDVFEGHANVLILAYTALGPDKLTNLIEPILEACMQTTNGLIQRVGISVEGKKIKYIYTVTDDVIEKYEESLAQHIMGMHTAIEWIIVERLMQHLIITNDLYKNTVLPFSQN